VAVLRDYPDAEIREEVKPAGRADNREVLQGVLRDLRQGDTLVVARLDRLSRSVPDAGTLFELAHRRGWSIVALDFGIDTSTANGELVANVLMSVARWESRMMGERISAALAAKRETGWDPRVIPGRTRKRIVMTWQAGATIADVTRRVGLHRETVVRVLRQELSQPSGPLLRGG
jgi:DNA invertase Pin-like site-specific DNA recombinase